MDEFVKKLIERLEELKKREMDREENITEDGYWEDCDEAFEDGESNGMYVAYTKAIQIVTDLAEKYGDAEMLNMAQMTADYNKAKLEELKRISNGGWIPCGDRLPEAKYGESKNVLCTVTYEEGYEAKWEEVLYFDGGNWCYPTGECYERYVIAWQPLPEPYKPKEQPDSISEAWKQRTMSRFERVE